MSNIHTLPIQKKRKEQTGKEYLDILNSTGEKIRDIFANIGEVVKMTGAFAIAIKTLSDDPLLTKNIPLSAWARLNFGLDVSEIGKCFLFEMSSSFREHLVPEYGIQSHTQFLSLSCSLVGEDPIKTAIFPTTIGQDLASYYASFNQVQISNLLFINYHVLFRLIEQPGLMYIKHGVVDSLFEVELLQKIDGIYWKLHYKADFLPVLLDNEASDFIMENKQEV